MEPLTPQEMGIRLLAAVILGSLVGLERERKSRPAGLRTMILISLGSAAFMMVALQTLAMYAGIAVNSGGGAQAGVHYVGQAEISRVLQGLVGGIGFLGAGAVIQNKRAVRGLTTAAAVWVVAAIGAACGLGHHMLAGMVAALSLFTLVVLELVENRFFPEPDDGAFDARGGGHAHKRRRATDFDDGGRAMLALDDDEVARPGARPEPPRDARS
ncbi:hypothetical protein BH11PLA1_BH11PLA1_15500 [soil metagenome]